MHTMPRVPPFDRPATYEDLEKLPPEVVAEIVDDELHASPRPAPRHAWASSRLGFRLGPLFDEGGGSPGGWIILNEPELHLGRHVVVPDLAGWRRSRWPGLPETAYFTLAPDWVCEVISPSTASLDRVKKLAVYARARIAHAWLIDPLAHSLEVLRLDHGHWKIVGAHAGREVVRAEPFSDLELDLRGLWGDDVGDG